MNKKRTKLELRAEWFANTTRFIVTKKPYKLWYEKLFEYITLGWYKASWQYKVEKHEQ